MGLKSEIIIFFENLKGKRLSPYKMYLTWVSDDVIHTTDSTHHIFIHIRSDKLLNENVFQAYTKLYYFYFYNHDSNGWRSMHKLRVLSKYTIILLFFLECNIE